jgi:nitrate/nitrite-specific signal transduction histidine kinase
MSDETRGIFDRGDEFARLFSRGAAFARELIDENRRLREQLQQFDEDQTRAARDPHDWGKLREDLLHRIDSLEAERKNVLDRLRHVEEENHYFAHRHVEVEEENNNLANLYVASYQLHSTLDLSEVLKIILEIVINLIGGEKFAVYVLAERSHQHEAVADEGEEVMSFPRFALGEGVVGAALESGETVCRSALPSRDLSAPMVCIPLRVQERPIGVIAIYQLLTHKEEFTPLDHELFTLLAGHAATALFAARLHSQSERKLNTIQGFIDLLTK